MPTFKNLMTFEVARTLKAFLNLEAGVTRGKIPEAGMLLAAPRVDSQARQLEQARQQLAHKDQQLAKHKERLAQAHQQLKEEEQENTKSAREKAVLQARLAAATRHVETGGVRPEDIVWIFGTARTGSSWLSDMMNDVEGYTRWNEPLVGDLFGHLYYIRGAHDVERRKHFVLGDTHRETWLSSIRGFVLNEVAGRFPGVAKGGYLVIKEPNGSLGAPLLMEALPESRMIFLMRDPRDIVASLLDANRQTGWLQDWKRTDGQKEETLADPAAHSEPDAFVQTRATFLLPILSNVKRAYDAHQGRKVLVKYEDLRSDALGTMRRIYSTLELPFEERELARVVEKHAWENVPEEFKGEGKFYRKAKPGGWREDLTSGQAEIVGRITGPLMKEFYPD